MTNHVLLDNITHKDLRIRQQHGAEFGDNVGTVPAFPTEFADVQREYPIFFRRDKNGDFYAVALLGFAPDENLYLNGDRWDAVYVPGIIARGPFLIGFQERQEGGELRREPVIHLDMDNPRVSQTEGERVFLEQGGHSPYLQRVMRVLGGLNDGHVISKAMFEAWAASDLIAPVDLEVKVTGAQPVSLPGFYTLEREKLNGLDSASLHKLHRSGFLHAAYLVLASHGNLNKLIDRKIKRVAAAAA
ncbi:MAG TPA: SapC family protein [Steroidobacteraceae bacterium]|nr:SapC family protein [Steroidobacteraceae bacterium]